MAIEPTCEKLTPKGNRMRTDRNRTLRIESLEARELLTVVGGPKAGVDARDDASETPRGKQVAIDVLWNDNASGFTGNGVAVAVEIDRASLKIAASPSKGTAFVSNGKINYKPTCDTTGKVFLRYSISDKTGKFHDSAQVAINVTRGLYAEQDFVTALPNSEMVIDVLSNDKRVVATSLTIVNPGSATLTPDQKLRFKVGEVGSSTSFSYTVRDTLGCESSALVSVTASNPPGVVPLPSPVAFDDTYETTWDTSIGIDPLQNDVSNSPPLKITRVNGVAWNGSDVISLSGGRLSPSVSGLTYAPELGFFGTESFTYNVTDATQRESQTAIVTIAVSRPIVLPPPGNFRISGDFSGDGLDDIATFASQDGSMWVLTSSGGSFTTSSPWAEGISPTTGWEFVVNDFTGDGKEDIAGYHASDGSWWMFRSTGTSFDTSRWLSGLGPTTDWTFLTGDFDGDRLHDIVGYQPSDGSIWMFRSTGASFGSVAWLKGLGPTSGWSFLAGDFNGDDRDDLAGYQPSDGSLWTFPSTGSSFGSSESPGRLGPRDGWSFLAGDYNGDRRDDVVGFQLSDGSFWAFLSAGDTFITPSRSWLSPLRPASGWVLSVGDYNADEKSDVAGYQPSDGSLWVFPSNGESFTSVVWPGRLGPTSGWNLLTGDFDGNGRDEIAGYQESDASYWVFDAGLLSSALWATSRRSARDLSAASGDVDKDGVLTSFDIDSLYASIGDNDTSGIDLNSDSRIDQADVSILVHDKLNTVFGDLNLDGRFDSEDLVLAFQYGHYADGISKNSSWLTGDFDGDGDFESSDLVVAFQDGGYGS